MAEPDPGPAAGGGSADGHDLGQRLGRRRLLAGLAAAVPLLTGYRLSRWGSRSAASVHPSGGAGALQASPETSAVASTAASPTVGALPVPPTSPTAAQPTFGALQVIHDQRPTYAASPVESDHLRLLIAQTDNADFSPAALRQDFQIPASYLDPLVRVDEVTMEPQPWLATSWSWSEDGKTITYKLRTDVRWHDGDLLTAKDVRFSFFVYRDDVASNVRNLFALMDDVQAVDDRTVKVVLTQPDGGWLLNASSQFVFQRKQYTKYWSDRAEGERTLTGFDWRTSRPVGTGPWKVTNIGKSGIDFARNDGYWAGPAHFKTLTIAWESDLAKRLNAWSGGNADLLWPVRANQLTAIQTNSARLYAADAASVMFAAFNFGNPKRDVPDLFADVGVRRALSLAINRARYASGAFGGFIQEGKAGTIAQPWAHDDTVANPARDVATAMKLLKQAGWEDRNRDGVLENADGRPLALTLIVGNDSRPELLDLLKSIADDLNDVGIQLTVTPLGPDQFRARWETAHDFDLIAYAYNLYAGFTDFDLYGSGWDIRTNPQGWNPGAYHDPAADAAIKDALVAEDLTVQKAALGRLQHAVNDDLFGLWFGFPQDLILVRPDVLGFQPNKLWQTWDTRKLWRQPG